MQIPRRLKKIWSDPVWSAVTASAIVSGGSGLIAWGRKTSLHWLLGYETNVLVLMLVAFVLAISIISSLQWLTYYRRIKEGRSYYNKDEFLGILWRWKYDTQNRIGTPIPFCVNCGQPLLYDFVGGSFVLPKSSWRCDHCGSLFPFPLETRTEIYDKVRFLISRNLTDGSWRLKVDA